MWQHEIQSFYCMHVLPYLQDKGKLLEDCRLQKVDLIAQVKQLQEKLNHLVCSMSFQNIEMEDFKHQQALASPCTLEDGLSDGSDNSEETNKSPPTDTFNIIWDLAEVTGNSDSLIRNKEPDAPTGEQVTLQDRSLCLQGHLHRCSQDLTHSQGSKPLKNVLRTMDVSPWSSPEVVREDSTLEPLPSLPLTPCSDALSLHSLDTLLQDGTSTHLLPADQSGRLCYPGESAVGTAPKWVGSPLAADGAPSTDQNAQRVPVVSGLPRLCPDLGPWDAEGQCVHTGLCLCGRWGHSCSHCWLTSWCGHWAKRGWALGSPLVSRCRDGQRSAGWTQVCCNRNI